MPVPRAVGCANALAFLLGGFLLNESQVPVLAQASGRITSLTLAPSNNVSLVVAPVPANADRLLLQSADSALGPWWKEPEFLKQIRAGSAEFLTPRKAYHQQRYYRFALFTQSPAASATLPYIRFIAPLDARPGQSIALLGANFAPDAGGNTVKFELPGRSWTAPILQAATNLLVASVPTNLVVSSTGTLYRVTVTTALGTGNGVGCTVSQLGANGFALRPSEVKLVQPPGNPTQTLVIGGGVPPYHLVPQSASDMANAVATLDGSLLTITAQTNVKFGGITVSVTDSSSTNFPQRSSAQVTILSIPFSPQFDATFHTLLAGTAPGLTMKVIAADFSNGNFQTERVEWQLQNVALEVARLQPEQVIGLLKFMDPSRGTPYAFQHLIVTEVTRGRARFDVILLDDGGVTTVAEGELIENPPRIVIHVPNLTAGSLVPQPLAQELIFADEIFRLPAVPGQTFSVTANFTSVSAREETYLPQSKAITRTYTTTGVATDAPRIERLVPVHGEVGRNVRLVGVGLAANPADNVVTFAGAGQTRVAGEIILRTNDEVVVTVPRDAVTGPVKVEVAGKTSNDFQFAVRFHPDSTLLFESLTNNVPVGLQLVHQQPVDEGDTTGEVQLKSILCTLDSGAAAVPGLTVGQQVGTAVLTSFYTGRQTTNLIVYAGRETNAPQRYLFRSVPSISSSLTLSRLYYSENVNGGITLELGPGDPLFPFSPGGMYDFQFTTPLYRPPAGDVAVRVESISAQWMAPPGNEMRRVVHSIQPVQ